MIFGCDLSIFDIIDFLKWGRTSYQVEAKLMDIFTYIHFILSVSA
jgi:hypothetical protein